MEQQTTTQAVGEQPSLFKHAAQYGAAFGGIGVVLTLLIYAVDYTMLASMWFGICMIALYIGLVIYAGINYRNQAGGYLSYGKAFQHGYVTMLSGAVVSLIFNMLLYNLIDPELPQKLADAIVENTEAMMRNFGAPEDRIDAELDKMRDEMPKRFSTVGLLTQFGWNFIVFAVLSAITSLFVKKSEPVEM